MGAVATGARPSAVPARPVQDVLRRSGQPLANSLREEMEARLGADFSEVRVHTDAGARASAAAAGAHAYTSGSHIVIGDDGADKHTLAHELTHVIQQRQGPVAGTGHPGGLKVSDPSDDYERAAEANAGHVMRTSPSPNRPAAHGGGEQQRTSAARQNASVSVQRRPQKDKNTKQYVDEDYPLLKLAKPKTSSVEMFEDSGYVPDNEYVDLDTGETIFYQNGFWYADFDCTVRVDMAAHQGNLDERKGISNRSGRSFYYSESQHTDSKGILSIDDAYQLAKDLNKANPNNRNTDKLKVVIAEIDASKTIHPIEVRMRENGTLELVEGFHRILASKIRGLKEVPYNLVQ